MAIGGETFTVAPGGSAGSEWFMPPVAWGSGKIAAPFSNYGYENGIWSHDGTLWKKLTDWIPSIVVNE